MVALSEFGISREDLRTRNLIKQPPADPTPCLIEQMRKAVCLFPANHIQMDPDGELMIVQGQLHFYRLYRSTGKMERVSDNKGLELNWAAIPDPLRIVLHRECDAPQQLDYRAHMLMYDSIYSRYFVIQ